MLVIKANHWQTGEELYLLQYAFDQLGDWKGVWTKYIDDAMTFSSSTVDVALIIGGARKHSIQHNIKLIDTDEAENDPVKAYDRAMGVV